MNRILVLNNVSKTGLKLFGDNYQIGPHITNPEAIIVRSTQVDTEKYPNLVAIARAGAGVNNITLTKATEKGVCVFNTPGANANAVAELVFIMLGLYARHVDKALSFVQTLDGDDYTINTQVEAGKSRFTGFELAGKTLAVIGLGKIGVLVANAGIERGMKVIGYDAFPTLTNMHQINPRVEIARHMKEVLEIADVLSVHVPLSEKTKNLIGATQIALMKDDCILMNYARNGIYDDTAVLEAIDRGKVKSFITDFPTKQLLGNKKVVCTPHLGASTTESEENCAVIAVRQLRNYLEYGIVTNSVNFPTVEMFPTQAIKNRLVIVNKDMPNMIAVITRVLGEARINIQALVNESNSKIGYNLIDVEVDICEEIAERIRQLPNVLQVRVLRLIR